MAARVRPRRGARRHQPGYDHVALEGRERRPSVQRQYYSCDRTQWHVYTVEHTAAGYRFWIDGEAQQTPSAWDENNDTTHVMNFGIGAVAFPGGSDWFGGSTRRRPTRTTSTSSTSACGCRSRPPPRGFLAAAIAAAARAEAPAAVAQSRGSRWNVCQMPERHTWEPHSPCSSIQTQRQVSGAALQDPHCCRCRCRRTRPHRRRRDPGTGAHRPPCRSR